MHTTKEKIIVAATKLFNQHGIANVRLQQIADEAGISVGNLAYHYRNKEAILPAVMSQVFRELNEIFSLYRQEKTLNDFNHQLDALYDFILTYPFYFLDFSELQRSYPNVHKKRQCYFNKMIQQLTARFDYHQKRGIVKTPCFKNQYELTANTTWMLLEFWLPQQVAREQNTNCKGSFNKLIWSQVIPHLTEEGWKEFDQWISPTLTHHSI